VHDVAAAAGISHATVSRYLNKRAYVSAAAAAAIETAIREVDYIPNRAARSLVRRRTHAVAFIVRAAGDSFFSDPTLNAMAMGANTVLSVADHQMLMMIVDSDRSADRIIEIVRGGTADGAILAAMDHHDPVAVALARTAFPIVTTSDPGIGAAVPRVDTDNVGGTRAITELLRATGRTRVGEVRGPDAAPVSGLRHRGFKAAMAGEYSARRVVAAGSWHTEDGAAAMDELLRRDPRIDAVVAASDSLAVGAMEALRRAGRLIPDDVAVVGFDDAPWASQTSPPLTTVRQDAHATGARSAELVLRMAEGEDLSGHSEVLASRVVWRDSAGPAPSM
jgi:DNA-binding LacI/PurR family transcriptional regulator